MPRLLFLLLLILTLSMSVFSACGDDDDDSGGSDDDAVIDDDQADDDQLDDDAADDDQVDDDETDDDAADDDQVDDDTTDDDTSGPDTLTVVHDFPPVAQYDEEYSYQFEATGGTPPYHDWQIIAGEIPEGWTFNANTGVLSGTADDQEKLYYFVVQVTDSAREQATASELFGVLVGEQGQPGPLLRKARAYQEVYDTRHNCDGLSVTADNPDDVGGDYWFTDLGDACFIHGNSSAGAAFWYAVEGSEAALENARLHTRGLDLLNRVNGIPGLLSRSYIHKDAPMGPNEFTSFWPESENHIGEGEFADYYWKGDVSIDQYSGELVGLSWIYDLVDDEDVRETVSRTVVEIADYLWDGGLIIYDADGEPTTYGDFRGYSLEGWPVPNGLNAAACLSWFKLAYHVSGELRFLDYYNELVEERRYDWVASNFLWVYLGYQTKHYNVYMGFENMFTLTRLENDPELHATFADGFRRLLWESKEDSLAWRRAEDEANPTFTPWYLYSTGNHDPERLLKAIWQLDMFVDAPLRDRYIQNSANPNIQVNPEQPDQALYPLPANLRIPDMCIWHRSPYYLDGGDDNGRERTGHDYLLPYWMGRYYGYIGSEW